MARDRKRAKQRRARRGAPAENRSLERAPAGPGAPAAPSGPSAPPAPAGGERRGGAPLDASGASGARPAIGQVGRADLPSALRHAGDVDEFDAALVAGAGGVAAAPDAASEAELEFEAEQAGEQAGDGAGVEVAPRDGGPPAGARPPGGPPAGGPPGEGAAERPSRGAGPAREGNRVIGFLRASWAELQRVQWPDRRHVFQATAVVLGFVAVAGLYLGLADYVAKEIVSFIL